jgi:secreted protein with Ig-like and vWFA domain
MSCVSAGPEAPITRLIDFPDVAKAASVVSVIDISGSMAGTKLASAKSASNAFIDMMSSGDKIGIVSFGSSASVRYSLTEIGDPEDTVKNQAKSAVSALSTSGSTRWVWASVGPIQNLIVFQMIPNAL